MNVLKYGMILQVEMIRRLYHVSFINYSTKKQGLKLCKMLNPRAKRQFYPTQTFDGLPTIKSLTKTKYQPGKQGVRRMAMLNNIFMKSITDLMSTGTMAMDIVGRGIEISKVNITPDYRNINVFWVCKGQQSDAATEAALRAAAGPLRHELSTLRLMGEVPYIAFVKDKQESLIVDIDRRLSAADYGDEYTPTDAGHILKSEFTLNTKLSPEIKAKIKQLEDSEELPEESIPEMTHNVYGLDHSRILNRLLAARKKSQDAWGRGDRGDRGDPVLAGRVPQGAQAGPGVDVGAQKQELADFLLKRQILQNKMHKQLRSEKRELQGLLPDDENNDDDQRYDNYDDYHDDDDEFYREIDRVERETRRKD